MTSSAHDPPDNSTPSDEDVPVNKTTTFNGVINKYIHLSPSKPDPKRRADSASPDPALSIKRTKSSPSITPTTTTTPARTIITRSRSSSSTPIPPPTPTNSNNSNRRIQRSRQNKNASTPAQQQSSKSNPISLLQDTIPPNLTLLLIGVNPGIMTGTTGFAYAHPSNLFWKLLHSSGITTIRHPPSDTYRLPELYNVGNTNIVERPTRDASMLSKGEMDAGVPVLEAKIAAKRPEAVCFVGKSIWEAVWRVRKGRAIRKEEFRYGWQDEGENMGKVVGDGESDQDGWKGARVFVATTTSGLAAGMTRAEKEAVWDELGKWVVERREAMKAKLEE